MATPRLLAMNGLCGGIVPGNKRIPVLAGPPVNRCPVAMGMSDKRIHVAALMVPTPHGPGMLEGVSMLDIPPWWRSALKLARAWLRDFNGDKS